MIDKEIILKETLIKVKENNFILENEQDYFSIGLEMIENIGSIDPLLRDKLIYTTFYYWITNNRFSNEQLRCLLQISLKNIFYKIYEKDDDAVFKRSFSVLIIALVINKHRTAEFLSVEELNDIKEKLLKYMQFEKDVRGYVELKGWAHSAAHTADALDELVFLSCLNKNDLLDILNSIKDKICIGYYVYIDEEYERLVSVIESTINRKILSNNDIMEWLLGFKVTSSELYIEKYHSKVNIKQFLRSLYLRLIDQEDSSLLLDHIKNLLNTIK